MTGRRLSIVSKEGPGRTDSEENNERTSEQQEAKEEPIGSSESNSEKKDSEEPAETQESAQTEAEGSNAGEPTEQTDEGEDTAGVAGADKNNVEMHVIGHDDNVKTKSLDEVSVSQVSKEK